jgi:PAS domain S-box-containing protein
VPVLFEGLVVGTVCVLDSRSRRLSGDQRAIIIDLAGMVEGLLQSRHKQVLLHRERQFAVELAAALGESEAMLAQAQRLARVGSWEIDVETGLVAWSAALYEIFGREVSRGPITVHEFREFVAENDRPEFDAIAQQAFFEHLPTQTEFRCVPPDGRARWISAASEPVRDAAGRVVRIRGTLQDVTERRLAERLVRESAERDRLLWQSSTDVVLMVGEDDAIRFCNPAILPVLGYLPDEVIGQRLAMLQPERLRGAHRHGFSRYLASGERRLDWRAVEVTALHRDGREIPVEISFSDMQADGHRVFGAFMRDITPRMRQQQALMQSEERYRRIVETAEEGIWMIDAATVTTFVNPKMARMLGYAADEMMGRSMYDFMDERAQADARENVRRREQGIAEQHDFRLTRKDGSDLWTAMSTSASFDDAGCYTGALAMVTDITEQRHAQSVRLELEAQLRESQKMEAIGVLAGGIAHDFNNVLAGILGNAALAIQDLRPEHPAAVSLEQIRKASLRGRGLVQQILAFARRQPREVVSCELPPLVDECIGLLRSTLPAGVTLDVSLCAERLFVMADATQVEQVLMNLCTNAWHSLGGKPGRIAVALAAVELDADDARHLGGGLTPGAYARLTVSDTGRGMDAETRARIFEPFFTTKPVGEGTGLGLAVAHGIIAAHGGVIRVQTAPGAGSAFEIYLPRSASTEAADRPVPLAIAYRGHGENVLYVDDDEVMVVMVERLLERLGYAVTCLHDPARAIEVVRVAPHAFDIVVSDLNMPELSGLDVARALHRIRADLPVIISSGNLPDQLQNEAREAGVRALVHKQYTLEELGPVIHWVLAGGQRLGLEPLQMSTRQAPAR